MWLKKRTTKDKIEDFLVNHHLIERRKFNWLSWVTIVLVIIIVMVLIFVLPLMVRAGLILKQMAQAENKVQVIIESTINGDWQRVNQEFDGLQQDVAIIQTNLGKLGPILIFPPVNKSIQTSSQLLMTTGKLMYGYQEVFTLLGEIQLSLDEESIAFGFTDSRQRQILLQSIMDNQEQFEIIKGRIDSAKAELQKINSNDLLGLFQTKIILYETVLEEVIDNSIVALPIFSKLPELMGYGGEKHYLFIFQNNMEMRPTGGFIGSYGIITVKDGEIVSLVTDDVYNLDRQSEGKLFELAPDPMFKYNAQKYWYMRDSNWSPDFPTATEKILWFFDIERKNAGLPPQKIDGVIAITPDFIANLLTVLGPIEEYGLVFDDQDFAMDLERFVEFDYVNYGLSSDERKKIIGHLTQTLIGEIYDTSPQQAIDLWLAFKKNIEQKHILVNLADDDLQALFSHHNWAGEVKPIDDDYLMVIDSDFASLKTNSVMDKGIDYSVSIDNNGDLIANLKLTYNHTGELINDLITRYRTYIRVYMPSGSRYISGYVDDGRNQKDLKLDSEIKFERDLDRKYLSIFLVIEPGSSKTLNFIYRLPDKVQDQYRSGLYKILVQKQSGSIGHNLNISLNFNQPIEAYQANSLPVLYDRNSVIWQTDLSVDREFIIKF